jgi:succinoglycan biosynthesis transport protein ExoP
MDTEQGIQLDDLKRILERRSQLVLAVAAAGLLLAIFVAAILPNQFESRATLLIEPQTISQKLVESNLTETELNSRLHLISMQILSRGRLSRVIDEFDVYPELERKLTREEIIEKMRSEISVTPVLSELEARVGVRSADVEINTFQLGYRHRNRDIAVANRLANDFVEEHIKERAEMSGDTSEFIEAELQRLSARIAELEEKISTVKSLNIGRLPEDLPTNQNRYERLMQSIRDTQRELAIAQSDEAFYRQQMLMGGTDLRFQNNDTPEKRIEQMRLALNEAQARGLTEKHPDVIRFRQEIAQLELAVKNSRAEDKPLSLAQENARAEQQRAGLRSDSARSELERLQEQLKEVEERMAETPKVAEQRRQKGEKFRVLEAAIPMPQPASPNRPVILMIGLVLGVLAGGGLGLLAEITDLSFHDARSLQSRLGIPVLAAVPPVLLESDRLFARARRVRQAIGAAAVVSLVLAASLAGNWVVNGPPGPLAGLVGAGAPAAPAPPVPSGE